MKAWAITCDLSCTRTTAWGLGHLRRNIAIAQALREAAPGCSILLTSGVSPIGQLPPGGQIDFVKLPELRKINNQHYGSRRLGLSDQEILDLRASILHGTIESFRPDLLLVDKHPLGAGGELVPGLEALRNSGGHAVLGLRDILDDPESVQREWIETDLMARVNDHYDEVLIYGQREIFDPIRDYCFPSGVTRRVRFCGYVVNPTTSELPNDSGLARFLKNPRVRPLVLATVGGGEDGFKMLQTFIEATRGAAWSGVVVAGPLMPVPLMKSIELAAAEAGVFFELFVAGLECLIGSFDALVCMGGYNTLVEGAACSVPTICVPRKTPRLEQQIRARRFEDFGLINVIQPEELTAARMHAELQRILDSQSIGNGEPHRSTLNLTGAATAAKHLLRMALDVRRRRERLVVARAG